ncbi:MAG: hypothetical protein V1649_01545 [Patescibacteria group bacterium]
MLHHDKEKKGKIYEIPDNGTKMRLFVSFLGDHPEDIERFYSFADEINKRIKRGKKIKGVNEKKILFYVDKSQLLFYGGEVIVY